MVQVQTLIAMRHKNIWILLSFRFVLSVHKTLRDTYAHTCIVQWSYECNRDAIFSSIREDELCLHFDDLNVLCVCYQIQVIYVDIKMFYVNISNIIDTHFMSHSQRSHLWGKIIFFSSKTFNGIRSQTKISQ